MKSIGPKEQELPHFKCNFCKDKGYIFKSQGLYEVAVKCSCQLLVETKSKMNNSGLGDLLEIRTFESYVAKDEFQKSIKSKAIQYTKEFLRGNRNSLAFLGQSGIGKSHLMIAVTKKLLDNNIDVKYVVADEIIQKLQACKFDEENYNKEFSKIANAGVLFIDDLFKTSITNFYKEENIKIEDLREIFQVINYRYNKRLPILLNSEIHFERFKELDQATIGRINEMCDYKYIVSIKPDSNKNYRLRRRI